MKNCPICGKENNDNAVFCVSCGSSLNDAPVSAPAYEPAASSATKKVLPGATYVSNDEYTVSTLTNSAVDNIFSGEGVVSEDAICTNKRFYYKKKDRHSECFPSLRSG